MANMRADTPAVSSDMDTVYLRPVNLQVTSRAPSMIAGTSTRPSKAVFRYILPDSEPAFNDRA